MAGHDPVTGDPPRPSVRQLARALLRLARGRHRLRHVPSVAQVAGMARWDGVEPCSYDLDPEAGNWIPGEAEEAVAAQRGKYGLCFTCERAGGRMSEFVVLDCGRAFDLRGSSRLERV